MKLTFPYLFLLFALFATLKLGGLISWSWLAVTSPLWVIPAIALGLIAALLIGTLFIVVVAGVVAAIGAFIG